MSFCISFPENMQSVHHEHCILSPIFYSLFGEWTLLHLFSGGVTMGFWRTLCNFNLFCVSLLFTLASANNRGNIANEFVNVINENRTSQKLVKLVVNPGLGCIALQYIEKCNGTCTSNGTANCQSSEDDFTEVFAPNCGVELATFGTISGRIVGCQNDASLKPSQAFSHQLVLQKKTLSMVKDKRHTEIGIGLSHSHHDPLFWCVLFSSDKINSTFILEGGGRGITQKRGCFSGTDAPCSRGEKINLLLNTILTVFSMFLWYINGIFHP